MRSPALAKIHIAKKDLGLSEDDYRAILLRVAGADSAARLDARGHAAVLREFQRLGWSPERKLRKSAKPGVRLIFGLWAELGRMGALVNATRPALLAFVKRQTGVDSPDWLTPSEVNKVVEGLKAMLVCAKAGTGA